MTGGDGAWRAFLLEPRKSAWLDDLGARHLVALWDPRQSRWNTFCDAVVSSVDPRLTHARVGLDEITCQRCLVEYAAARLRSEEA